MGLADDLFSRSRRGAFDGLEDVAKRVLAAAQDNVPVGDPAEDPDPGVSLRESGRIDRHGNGFIISFDAPYAAKQHEDLRLKHPRGGGPKYLERALTEMAPTIERFVASKVNARTATGLLSDPGRSHHRGGRRS